MEELVRDIRSKQAKVLGSNPGRFCYLYVLNFVLQLTQFSESLYEYHKNCTEILKVLTETLYEKTNEASAKPKQVCSPFLIKK